MPHFTEYRALLDTPCTLPEKTRNCCVATAEVEVTSYGSTPMYDDPGEPMEMEIIFDAPPRCVYCNRILTPEETVLARDRIEQHVADDPPIPDAD